MFDLFSPVHIAILLAVVLLIFGPKRLPDLGKSVGQTLRMFRNAQEGREESTTSVVPAPPDSSGNETPH